MFHDSQGNRCGGVAMLPCIGGHEAAFPAAPDPHRATGEPKACVTAGGWCILLLPECAIDALRLFTLVGGMGGCPH